jgi:hypothetical protein
VYDTEYRLYIGVRLIYVTSRSMPVGLASCGYDTPEVSPGPCAVAVEELSENRTATRANAIILCVFIFHLPRSPDRSPLQFILRRIKPDSIDECHFFDAA